MLNKNTDKEWERFGKDNPYFGVLSHEEYHDSNLTEESKIVFFETGANYINDVLEKVRRYIDTDFTIDKALDFGCGVGRLVIPLAAVSQSVVGVDISESMLKEARANSVARSIKNITFIKSDDDLTLLDGKYNFIHSFIVFQHIPVERGEKIFKQLVNRLEDGGVFVVQFTYASVSKFKRFKISLKRWMPFLKNILNLLRKKKVFSPEMQMNAYSLNHLFRIVQHANAQIFYTEFSNHDGELGVTLYFQKPYCKLGKEA